MPDLATRLYEKSTEKGMLVVENGADGKVLTLDSQPLISELDGFLYHEMMAHPALFTHARPQKVAILGPYYGILQEVLKHLTVNEVCCINEHNEMDKPVSLHFPHLIQEIHDTRVRLVQTDVSDWLKNCESQIFDVVIVNTHAASFSNEIDYQQLHRILHDNGLLIGPCETSILSLHLLKPLFEKLHTTGFLDKQTLNFPQPSYPTGWRTLIMTNKQSSLRRIREKDVFNRSFKTRYYNFDTHKAALALPEYIREELLVESLF